MLRRTLLFGVPLTLLGLKRAASQTRPAPRKVTDKEIADMMLAQIQAQPDANSRLRALVEAAAKNPSPQTIGLVLLFQEHGPDIVGGMRPAARERLANNMYLLARSALTSELTAAAVQRLHRENREILNNFKP